MTQQDDAPQPGEEKRLSPSPLDGAHKISVIVAASLTSLGVIVGAAVFTQGHLATQADVDNIYARLNCVEERANYVDVRAQAASKYTEYANAKVNVLHPQFLERLNNSQSDTASSNEDAISSNEDAISSNEDAISSNEDAISFEEVDVLWGTTTAYEKYVIPEALKEQTRACQEDWKKEDL